MANPADKNVKLGILCALTASLCYTVMNLFVKILGDGQSTLAITFFRFAIGLLILLPWLLTERNLFKVDNKAKVLLRCITTIAVVVCVFYSLNYMPLTNVLLLQNTFPLFLPLLTWLLLGIKTPIKMIMGMLLGFVGVALVLHPGASGFNWHALVALFAGFLAALAMLQIRMLTHSSNAKQILFYVFAFGTIVTGVAAAFSFKMPTPHQMLLLLLIGFFGAVYQVLLTLALQFARARIVSPMYFSCIIFSALFDWIIWAIKPELLVLVGMAFIIIGGVVTILMAD